MIPGDWEESSILNLNKGNGEALDCGNYHSLKLTDQVMKLLEWVLDSFIHQVVKIDEMTLCLVEVHVPLMPSSMFLYADDLVLIGDTQRKCISKLKASTAGMDSKRLCVSMKKVHGLRRWPGCPKEIRQASLCCLLEGCRQQLHRVLAMQAVGPREMQWHHWSTGGRPELHLPKV